MNIFHPKKYNSKGLRMRNVRLLIAIPAVLFTASCDSSQSYDGAAIARNCMSEPAVKKLEYRAKQGEPSYFNPLHAYAALCTDPTDLKREAAYARQGIIYGNARFLYGNAVDVFEMAKEVENAELSLKLIDLAKLRLEQISALSQSTALNDTEIEDIQKELPLVRQLYKEINWEARERRAALALGKSGCSHKRCI